MNKKDKLQFLDYYNQQKDKTLTKIVKKYENKTGIKINYHNIYDFINRQNKSHKNLIELNSITKKYNSLKRINKNKQFEISRMNRLETKYLKNLNFRDWYENILKKSFKLNKSLKVIDLRPIEMTSTQLFIFIGDFQFCGFKDELLVFLKYFKYLENYCEKNKIKNINLCFMGDMVDGDIHLTSLELHNKGLLQQSVVFQETLGRILTEFSKKIKTTVFYLTQDNHGETRQFNTMRGQREKENVNYLIGSYLKAISQNNNNLDVKTAPHFSINLGNHILYLTHGDLCPAPSRMTNWIKDYRLSANLNFNHIYMGHFHHYERKQIYTGLEYTLIPTCKTKDFPYEKRGNYNSEGGILLAWFNNNGLIYDQIIKEKQLEIKK